MKTITALVDENKRLRRRVALLEDRLRRAGTEAGDLVAQLTMTQQHLEATAEDRARIIARNQQLEALIGGK